MIVVPVSGVVGARQAQIGKYVQPGTQLMTIVPMVTIYVVANFKETQTARMLVGQHAHLEVDALPGKTIEVVVESFAPASGLEFSLLPFEPATGNFTRIVQRVPVRICLSGWSRRRTLAAGPVCKRHRGFVARIVALIFAMVHGFRSTFRDWVEEATNYSGTVAEAALAHVAGDKVEAAYRRGDLFEKRRKPDGRVGDVLHDASAKREGNSNRL